ncbi:transposase [Lactobacillus agilis]|uniref:Transposase n=1 Tax=Ligilactobacillus agilis TaxID=1601 RepID=A0A848C6S5_9LACO|nr:helix-turn-helix domain-containing protein [Ligilactobacillus agilis]NME43183.1 transposase [Ligilactobacillus agilis]
MAHKGYRYTLDEKLRYIKLVKKGATTIAVEKEYGVDHHNLNRWLERYDEHGIDGLLPRPVKRYSTEFKMLVVKKHLAGASLGQLRQDYDISNEGVIQRWVNLHSDGKRLKTKKNKKAPGKQSRKTTLAERLEIVNWTIDNHYNYNLAVEHFNVSYTQVYSWVRKFSDGGKTALIDWRGKRKNG